MKNHYAAKINMMFAAVTMVTILIATYILWPIGLLGFVFDPETQQIERVEPNSPADQSGLEQGDIIIAMYDRPMAEVMHSNLFKYVNPPGSVAPIIVERNEQRIKAALQIPWPSFQFQVTKIAFLILSLSCWLTGYTLGIVRRHDSQGSPLVALFWFGIATICGSLPLAIYAAESILIIIQWLIPILFVPLSIYIHTIFPRRTIISTVRFNLLPTFILSWFPLLAIVIWAMTTKQSILAVEAALEIIVSLEVLCALAIVVLILQRSYRETVVAHTKRQIRIIASASTSVLLINIIIFVIPPLLFGHQIIDTNWGFIVLILVPIAYLISGVAPDLYRPDHIFSHILYHLLTTTILISLLAFIGSILSTNKDITAFLTIIAFVFTYQASYNLVQSTFGSIIINVFTQNSIENATRSLNETLDTRALFQFIAEGVNQQFGEPAFAIYKGDIHGSNILTLAIHQRIPDAPQTLLSGVLTDAMKRLSVIDARELHKQLGQKHLTVDEQQLVAHPAIALWCPIVHSHGYLLGLMVLGMRRDFDPYREVDRQQLQSLLNAAALALANSAALTQQQESEEIIRGLYQRVLHAYDIAARNIAAELHADVINGAALFNLYDLEAILDDVNDQSLKSRIAKVIDGEHTLMGALRGICEQLHPTGIDDPLGLPGAIRTLLEKTERNSGLKCCLYVHKNPLELGSTIQYEALRTVREAVSNAVKHANATTISVSLQYPIRLGDIMTLEIVDDGKSNTAIEPKPYHWGIRTIQESARIIHGIVDFKTEQGKGTCVRLTFPTTYSSSEESKGEADLNLELLSHHMPDGMSPDTKVPNYSNISNSTLVNGA